jgi:transcriptional regulator with XRE-family HTH domain
MLRKNITGRQVAYWRYQNNWTQETLAARLQCLGYDISREMVANIELGLRGVEDNWLPGFQEVFGLAIIQFFPKEIRDADAQFAQHPPAPLPDPDPPKKRRRQCPKLTKRRKPH